MAHLQYFYGLKMPSYLNIGEKYDFLQEVDLVQSIDPIPTQRSAITYCHVTNYSHTEIELMKLGCTHTKSSSTVILMRIS
jgi:hypothetical protein